MALLLTILPPTLRVGSLIGRAEQFNGRNDPATVAMTVNIQKDFMIIDIAAIFHSGIVLFRQNRQNCRPEIGNERIMVSLPARRVFQIGIHSGKWARHPIPPFTSSLRSKRVIRKSGTRKYYTAP